MNCPIPNATGTLRPEGSGTLGVLILGEAMGEAEANDGLPFRPYAPAGSVLERAIRRLGMMRDQFVIWNVVPTRPPNNYLEGAPYELAAIEWGKPQLQSVIDRFNPRCVVALGSIATRVMTGLSGPKLGVSDLCGFVLPSQWQGADGRNIPVIPCFHPAYLRRGEMSHFGVLLRALRLATQVAREGHQPSIPNPEEPPPGYITYPTEAVALKFEETIRDHPYLAYDIETAHSTAEEKAEEEEGDKAIISIQFSSHTESGIFLPWREPFIDIAKRCLGSGVAKLGWNVWRFDNPILRAAGCNIRGEVHDLMWAWHHTQPDLPRGLQFAAGQRGWGWPWKHLDRANPAFYGIVDVDVLHYLA